jgi:hypothetical protein
MSKGVVLRIDRKWSYVFTTGSELVKMHVQPQHAVGKEVIMETERKQSRKAVLSRRWVPALVTAALVFLVGFGLVFGQGLIAQPVYATMSIDINPSLELSLDRELKVLSVRAMNQDAEQVLSKVQLKGLYWKTAVERWVEAVRATNQFQIETMLVSAVLPEDALQLKTELQTMQENPGTGVMANIQVRTLYTADRAVTTVAQQNGLSVGRQMLLTQSEVQNQNYDAAGIENAPLGDLIQTLLQTREMDQTGYTWHGAKSPTGQPSVTGSEQGNQNGNSDVTPAGNQNQGTPNPSCTPAGDQNQNQNQGTPAATPGAGSENGNENVTPNPSCTPQADPTGAMKGR